MPEEILETQQTIQPVETKSTDWTKIILAAVLGLGLLAGAAYVGYYYGVQQVLLVEESAPAISQPTTKPTPTPTPEPTPTPLAESFQQILTETCRKIGDEASFFYGIDPKVLPVLIDPAVINIKLREQGTVICTGELDGAAYVAIEYGNNYGLNVYDENSKELGHGGPSFLGIAAGPIIKEVGSIKLAVYLSWPHGGPALVGDLSVMGRGEKKMKLSNGDTIFVNSDRKVIDGDDPRLVELLNDYSEESEFAAGRREIVNTLYSEVQSAVVDRFFGNVTNLESPEQENIKAVEESLDAITAL